MPSILLPTLNTLFTLISSIISKTLESRLLNVKLYFSNNLDFQSIPSSQYQILSLSLSLSFFFVLVSRDDLQELLDRLVFDGKVVKKIKPGMGSGEWDDDDEVDEDVEYGGGRGRPRKRIKIQSLSEEEEEEEEGDDEIGGEEILGFIDDADGDEGGGEASSSTTKKINYDIWMYTAVRDSLSETSWTSVPCGRCPVFEFCTLGKGPVTPSNCVYFKEWLLKE